MQPVESAKTPKNQAVKYALWLGFLIAAIVTIAVAIRGIGLLSSNNIVRSFYVPSGAMLPTLQIREIVIADMRAYTNGKSPKIGDIVAFYPPAAAIAQIEEKKDIVFISRCVGVAGDTIEVRKGILFRNGSQVSEPFIQCTESGNRMNRDFKLVKNNSRLQPVCWREGELPNLGTFIADDFWASDDAEARALLNLPAARIPSGSILTMGDNRDNSFDGRSWGALPISSLIGKVMK